MAKRRRKKTTKRRTRKVKSVRNYVKRAGYRLPHGYEVVLRKKRKRRRK